jgi:hypothetical protein
MTQKWINMVDTGSNKVQTISFWCAKVFRLPDVGYSSFLRGPSQKAAMAHFHVENHIESGILMTKRQFWSLSASVMKIWVARKWQKSEEGI